MKQRKIIVATSYRNTAYENAVIKLKQWGHEVYDFKAEDDPAKPFSWSDIDPEYKTWTLEKYRTNLVHEKAVVRFRATLDAMAWADVCLLMNPAGSSSHLLAGWFIGKGKPCIIILDDKAEPELMYKLAGFNTAVSLDNAINMLEYLS